MPAPMNGSGYGKGRRRLANEINVVPYIDVMLVLLIIFMVTAPLLTTGIEVEPPQADANPLDSNPENEPLELRVSNTGGYYLNLSPDFTAPLSDEDVIKYAAIVLRRSPDKPVVVRGDKRADYGSVVHGMVLLQDAGAKQVGLITDPEDSN